MDPSSNFSSYRSTLKAAMWRSAGATDERQRIVVPFFSLLVKDLYFLNEGCSNKWVNTLIPLCNNKPSPRNGMRTKKFYKYLYLYDQREFQDLWNISSRLVFQWYSSYLKGQRNTKDWLGLESTQLLPLLSLISLQVETPSAGEKDGHTVIFPGVINVSVDKTSLLSDRWENILDSMLKFFLWIVKINRRVFECIIIQTFILTFFRKHIFGKYKPIKYMKLQIKYTRIKRLS